MNGSSPIRLACLLIALLCIPAAAPAAAAGAPNVVFDNWHDDTVLDFGAIVRRAAIVARVRLTGRTEVSLTPRSQGDPRPALGQAPSCGYLYHAEIVDALKGEHKAFDFFASEDADFSGFNHDYLVYVFERKPAALTGAFLALPTDVVSRLNCLLSQHYYVGSLMQTMLSFSGDSTKILQPNREGLGWCAPPTADRPLEPRDWETVRRVARSVLAPAPPIVRC